jgi:hypothetical protein
VVGDGSYVHKVCIYPGCSEDVTKGAKWCPTHSKEKTVPKVKSREVIDWESEIGAIQKLAKSRFPIAIDLSSPGTAQVTRVRLNKKPYTEGLKITTEGPSLIFEKVS